MEAGWGYKVERIREIAERRTDVARRNRKETK
jgi:hypothetical protein